MASSGDQSRAPVASRATERGADCPSSVASPRPRPSGAGPRRSAPDRIAPLEPRCVTGVSAPPRPPAGRSSRPCRDMRTSAASAPAGRALSREGMGCSCGTGAPSFSSQFPPRTRLPAASTGRPSAVMTDESAAVGVSRSGRSPVTRSTRGRGDDHRRERPRRLATRRIIKRSEAPPPPAAPLPARAQRHARRRPRAPATHSAMARIHRMPRSMTQSAGSARPRGAAQAATTAAGMTTAPMTGTDRTLATSP